MDAKATGKHSAPVCGPGNNPGVGPRACTAWRVLPWQPSTRYFLAGASSAAVVAPLGGLTAVVVGEWAPAASSGLASGAT